MQNDAPQPLCDLVADWPAPAANALWQCRAMFHDSARRCDVGTLDEALKWGQPSWRPRRNRTGSTLRMGWNPAQPSHISLFVDCKTDLAARLQELYPQLTGNDGRRQIILDLDHPLPEQAIAHLADMTFTYHKARKNAAS